MKFWSRVKKGIGFEEIYTLAYRKKASPDDFIGDGIKEFDVLSPTKDYWYADPMLYEYDGNSCVFFEMYNRKTRLGGIGVCKMTDEGLSTPQLIISEPFHMSFPFLFQMSDRLFMLPETSMAGSLIFYECISFPLQWKRHTEQKGFADLVDTVVLPIEDQYFLVSSRLCPQSLFQTSVAVFQLSLENNVFVVAEQPDFFIPGNEPSNRTRNAGAPFWIGDVQIWPTQTSTADQYGLTVVFHLVQTLDKTQLRIQPFKEIQGIDLKLKTVLLPIGTHTYTSTAVYEIVDVKFDVFNPLKWYWRIKRRG